MRRAFAATALCLFAHRAKAAGPDGYLTFFLGVGGMRAVSPGLTGMLLLRHQHAPSARRGSWALAGVALGWFRQRAGRMQGLETRVSRGALQLHEGAHLPLGDTNVSTEWLGREVSIGIRPEHLLPAHTGDSFDAEVEVVEPVGSEVYANLRFGPHALIARFPPDTCLPEPGRAMALQVSSRHLHVFDAGTGERLPR